MERPGLNHQINEEAARWFVELRSEAIDEAGRRAFDKWMRASPEHLRAFLQIAALWGHSASVDLRGCFSTDALIASAREATNVTALPRSSSVERPHKGRRIWLAAAAITVLLAGSLVTWSILRQRQIYSTEVGEQRTLRLTDGSTVTLNSRTRARIGFDGSSRTVDLLEGEALFRVAHETSRPFVVRADGSLVRAIATEFDVDERSRGTVVTVIQGRVAVSPPDAPFGRRGSESPRARGEPIFISAGEQLELREGATRVPTPTDVGSATAWMQGKVMLQSATLEEVAERFNRYSQRQLITEDHGTVPFHLSGVFSTDPDFLIRYLRERPDIQVQESATQIRIIRTGAG